jgi:hypothetical protein
MSEVYLNKVTENDHCNLGVNTSELVMAIWQCVAMRGEIGKMCRQSKKKMCGQSGEIGEMCRQRKAYDILRAKGRIL